MNDSNLQIIAIALVGLALIVSVVNMVSLSSIQKIPASTGFASLSSPSSSQSSGNSAVSLDVLPEGVPEIYGEELGISYDDISASNPQEADSTIRKLALLDTSIKREGKNLERYTAITTSISCEYCCSAEAITFSNGEPACGCAHSYAMRGLAKYLLTNHSSEFSDAEILEELGKWKALFFPEQTVQKAGILSSQGIELSYINLSSNKYRGIEQGSSSNMVGGC